MSDRFVRKVNPAPERGELAKPFSVYLKCPNIVLLGDPGAGKSHLLRHFSKVGAGALLLRARDFLNLDVASLSANKTLFIDALDERRTGRGDQSTIDAIVRHLFLVKPDQVRITCRASDWLGETDLAAFQTYFDRAGGSVVLSLEPLSYDECLVVLKERGVSEPEEFLEQAKRRGLDELLSNPQNLIMLSDVVQKGSWPKSRTELFRKAVDLLLSEHDVNHTRHESGSYTSDELVEAAGSLCAVRLISDIDGISLTDTSPSIDLPSYRNINVCDRNRIQAALGRRAFVSGPIAETVDYAHRTIAEYLAASWLAQKVYTGLPIGRVRALIGVDGRPTSELRGLHAWLTIFLPEHAATLIDADPFGVLSYGDASSLTPELRKHLLEALAKLADTDPWFRSENWSTSAVAALSGPDMVESFRTILEKKNASFSLRSIVLDSLSAGSPIQELQPELLAILTDTDMPYRLRHASLEGLVRLGAHGADAVASAYRNIGSSAEDLRFRADTLHKLYRSHFEAATIAALLNEALECQQDLVGGAFWKLDEAIPDNDVGDILDRLDVQSRPAGRRDFRNTIEVLHFIDKLLIRVLSLTPDIDGDRLRKWLDIRWQYSEGRGHVSTEELKKVLSSNKSALARVTDAAIQSLVVDDRSWGFIHRLRELTLFSLEDGLLLDRISHALDKERSKKKVFLYEIAITLTFHMGATRPSLFERLYEYAEGDEALLAVRTRCCFVEIPEWKKEQSQRSRAHAVAREAGRAKNRSNFQGSREQVRRGTHFGWLGWIGEVYFSRFSDVNSQVEPRDRLVTELGEENTQAALEGLVALILHGQITPLQDVVRMDSEGKYCRWWYAVFAGLDEYTDAGHSIDAFPDDYFRSVLAIDCLHPTFWHEGNTMRHVEHAWKTDLLRRRPQLAVDAYSALTRASLARKAQHVHGLHELMHLEPLEPFRTRVTMALLKEFPTASTQALQHLLPAALSSGDLDDLLGLVRIGLVKCKAEVIADSYVLWLATGFLLAPSEFRHEIENLEKDTSLNLIWALRDLMGFRRRAKPEGRSLSVEQLEYIARFTASHFTRTQHPRTGWSGDTNPWDATELVQKTIALISADTSAHASEALTRLAVDSAMESYRDDVKHALAQHRIRRIDAHFQQPSWKEVVVALMNGTPAGIADLHALILAHLIDLGPYIASANTDIYKRFWNEDGRGKITGPKSEDSCRDVLVDLLRTRLGPQRVTVEPEGHMASDKRADIVAILPKMKVVIELKRDYHAEVWTAIQDQLDRFYTRDPDARGFGIYGVFWYGVKRRHLIPKPPEPLSMPLSTAEMQRQLQSLIPSEKNVKLQVVVIDVSGELP